MYDPLYESEGVLRYSGTNRLALEVDQAISDYYRSMIPKYFSNNRPRWPAHVTVVREEKEEPTNKEFWGRYEGEVVQFLYCPIVEFDRTYFWLNVFCTKLEKIRMELGLPYISRYTLPPSGFLKCFHMTIANSK